MFENVVPIQICRGLISPEGPSFNRNGVLHFVDWDAKAIYRVFNDGKLETFVNTGGLPTGSKFHKDGRLFVADGDLGILAINSQGKIQVLACEWEEGRFRGPNDLVFARNGDLYFTDPRDSDPLHPIGNIFIMRKDGQVEHFAGGFQFPNGILLSDDGFTLYVAETYLNVVWEFRLDEKGHETSRRVFTRLEGGVGPDGMAFDQEGNLYVAHFGKGVVAVIDPTGRPRTELSTAGMKPTNVAFWNDSLYVTEIEHSQVIRLDISVQGQILFGLS